MIVRGVCRGAPRQSVREDVAIVSDHMVDSGSIALVTPSRGVTTLIALRTAGVCLSVFATLLCDLSDAVQAALQKPTAVASSQLISCGNGRNSMLCLVVEWASAAGLVSPACTLILLSDVCARLVCF